MASNCALEKPSDHSQKLNQPNEELQIRQKDQNAPIKIEISDSVGLKKEEDENAMVSYKFYLKNLIRSVEKLSGLKGKQLFQHEKAVRNITFSIDKQYKTFEGPRTRHQKERAQYMDELFEDVSNNISKQQPKVSVVGERAAEKIERHTDLYVRSICQQKWVYNEPEVYEYSAEKVQTSNNNGRMVSRYGSSPNKQFKEYNFVQRLSSQKKLRAQSSASQNSDQNIIAGCSTDEQRNKLKTAGRIGYGIVEANNCSSILDNQLYRPRTSQNDFFVKHAQPINERQDCQYPKESIADEFEVIYHGNFKSESTNGKNNCAGKFGNNFMQNRLAKRASEKSMKGAKEAYETRQTHNIISESYPGVHLDQEAYQDNIQTHHRQFSQEHKSVNAHQDYKFSQAQMVSMTGSQASFDPSILHYTGFRSQIFVQNGNCNTASGSTRNKEYKSQGIDTAQSQMLDNSVNYQNSGAPTSLQMNKQSSQKDIKRFDFNSVYQEEVNKLRLMNKVLSTLETHTASNKNAPIQSAINNFLPLTGPDAVKMVEEKAKQQNTNLNNQFLSSVTRPQRNTTKNLIQRHRAPYNNPLSQSTENSKHKSLNNRISPQANQLTQDGNAHLLNQPSKIQALTAALCNQSLQQISNTFLQNVQDLSKNRLLPQPHQTKENTQLYKQQNQHIGAYQIYQNWQNQQNNERLLKNQTKIVSRSLTGNPQNQQINRHSIIQNNQLSQSIQETKGKQVSAQIQKYQNWASQNVSQQPNLNISNELQTRTWRLIN